MRKSGQLEDASGGDCRSGIQGNLKTRSDESRRAWDAGKLEEQDAGSSLEGCRRRGNSQPHPRLTGDDDPVSCKDIRKAPGTKVFGAFDFSGDAQLWPARTYLSETSRRNRVRYCSLCSPPRAVVRIVFKATVRPTAGSRALKTLPIAPRPSSPTISYLPIVLAAFMASNSNSLPQRYRANFRCPRACDSAPPAA